MIRIPIHSDASQPVRRERDVPAFVRSGGATDGAASSHPASPHDQRTGTVTCPYCGVGCRVRATARANQVVHVEAEPQAAPNFGMLCPKGALLFKADDPARRLKHPMLRLRKHEPLRQVSWADAIDFVAERLDQVRFDHSADALGFYGSGQLDTEASYLFTKLFKGYLGTNNTDTNSRLCMSSAVAGYIQAFASDGPPTCYDDINHAEVFLVVGANMAANHPVLFNMVRRRRAMSVNSRIIVLDPRRTKTAEFADVHVPLAPGSDVAFLQLIQKRLLREGRLHLRYVRRYTEGFEAYREQLDLLDEAELLAVCDVHPARVDEVVHLLQSLDAADPRLLSFYCMGTNQSSRGTDKNAAIINLHLQLGAVGRKGAGPFSLTGQPNAMGGREVGYLAHQLPGYRLVTEEDDRGAVERFWRVPAGSIRAEPGLPAVAMFEAAAAGKIRALWIACTNPAASMPDLNRVQQGLTQADLVIVQDCYHPTETTQYADVLLPAATWGEKVGTSTNSERLVARSEKLIDPPGEAMPDWWIFRSVARSMGFSGFDFNSAEQVWDEYRQLTAGTLCDQAGMTNQRLRVGPLQWPCPDERHPGTPRRYLRGRFPTSSGQARFLAHGYVAPAERPDADYPLVLTTGRIATQWHTRTRTGHIPELVRQEPAPFIEMHPADAASHGLADGAMALITGRRGTAAARVRLTQNIRQGLLFMPFHWGDLFDARSNPNDVTQPAVDPVSKQPELKHCAVRVSSLADAATDEGGRQL